MNISRMLLLLRRKNLIANGAFNADTDWTKEAGWTISGGVATSTGGTSTIYQLPSIIGVPVRVKFSIVARSGDTAIRLRCGAAYVGSSLTAVGSYTVDVDSPTSVLLGFYGDGTTGSISIDDVTVTRR